MKSRSKFSLASLLALFLFLPEALIGYSLWKGDPSLSLYSLLAVIVVLAGLFAIVVLLVSIQRSLEGFNATLQSIRPEAGTGRIHCNDDLCAPVVGKINEAIAAIASEHDAAVLSAANLEALLSASPDTILTFDREGVILSSTIRGDDKTRPLFDRVFRPGNNVRNLDAMSAETFAKLLAAVDAETARNSSAIHRFPLRDKEGAVFWIEARLVRIGGGRVLSVNRDITFERSSTIEKSQLEEKVTQMQKSASFGLIAGGLAHDYNNLLTAMLGNVEIILCDAVSDRVRETATDLRVAMLHASALVRRMLSYTKSEPNIEPTDVNALVRDLVRLMLRSVPDNARLVLATGDRVPVINADSTQFWQVVINLVVNACDALQGKPGTVRVTTLEMKFASAEELAAYKSQDPLKPGTYAVLEVSDTGAGMDDRTKARIFEPFFTTKTNGRGLGLASVFSIVRAYGAGIAVNSHPGEGTTFRVVLPAAIGENGSVLYPDDLAKKQSAFVTPPPPPAPQPSAPVPAETPSPVATSAPAPQPATSAPASATPEDAAKGHILIVDDDASILKLLQIILKGGGYKITTASSGTEGLKTYEKLADSISLALVDASMGVGMNGLELCTEIRKRSETLPLVLMSAYKAKEMGSRITASGITGFLPKPFRSADVLDLVAKYMKDAPAK